MTNYWQELLIALAASGVLVVLVLGAFGWFWRRGYTFAESGAYAIVSTLMALSFLFQLTFLVGYPQLSLICEALWFLWVVRRALHLRHLWGIVMRSSKKIYQKSPLIMGAVLLAWCYIGLQAFLLPPESWYWQHLVPVLWLDRAGSFFGGDGACRMLEVLAPINHSILAHFFLRFHSDMGIGLFNFFSYIAIGLVTYALARRYAWPPTAFSIAIVALCLPRFVYLSSTPDTELIAAAVSVFCLLAIYRLVEQPNPVDFVFVAWGILFVISDQPLSPVFAFLLGVLAVVLLIRRHGTLTWQSLIIRHRRWMLVAILPMLIFSQSWLYFYNILDQGAFDQFTLMAAFPQNPDVIKGALANFLRYGFESFHLTQMIEAATIKSVGVSLVALGQKFYDAAVLPLLGANGALQPFHLRWSPNGILSWFGPLGALLIFPALVYALARGQRRLKATALVLVGYLYIVVLIVAWKPGNASYFSILFSCSAFLAAFLLPPWRISDAGKKRLQGLCLLLLYFACLFNTAKPAAGYASIWLEVSSEIEGVRQNASDFPSVFFENSIWKQARWGQARAFWAQKKFGDRRIESLSELLPMGATLYVSVVDQSLLYPLLLHRPDLSIYSYSDTKSIDCGGDVTIADMFLLALDHEIKESPVGFNVRPVWVAKPAPHNLPGELRKAEGALFLKFLKRNSTS